MNQLSAFGPNSAQPTEQIRLSGHAGKKHHGKMGRMGNPAMLALALAVSCFSGAEEVYAKDDIPDYASETLTGDWGGTREKIHERGILLDLSLKVDLLRNRGGLADGGHNMRHLDIKLKADMEKILGWRGATGFINLIHDSGDKLNERYTGSFMGVSNIEVPVDTHRFFHAWIQQEFGEGRFSLLAGLYPIDSEFQVLESAALFVQPPYGPTADLSLTRGPSIFNNPAFGLRAKWYTSDRTIYAQGAILDGVPGDLHSPKGTHIRFEHGDGGMAIVEFGWNPFEKGHTFEPVTPDKGVPMAPAIKIHETADEMGKLALGFWGYSALVDDLVDINADGTPAKRKSQGWYVLAERTLWRGEDGRDLAGFARYSKSDGDSTALDEVWSLGLNLNAPFASRPDDRIGLAYTRSRLGAKFMTAQNNVGVIPSSYEDAWELTYRIQASKWLAIQPLWQRFGYPGGDQSIPRANIMGVRAELVF